ncbi:MAG: hypothetical protein ACXWBP_12370, partial [Limisphaerales bacterium]
ICRYNIDTAPGKTSRCTFQDDFFWGIRKMKIMERDEGMNTLASLKQSIEDSEASLRQLKQTIEVVDARLRQHSQRAASETFSSNCER